MARTDIQIDHLNLENYSNLDAWVASLNERIDQVFGARLTAAVESWCEAFNRTEEELANGDEEVHPSSIKVS